MYIIYIYIKEGLEPPYELRYIYIYISIFLFEGTRPLTQLYTRPILHFSTDKHIFFVATILCSEMTSHT